MISENTFVAVYCPIEAPEQIIHSLGQANALVNERGLSNKHVWTVLEAGDCLYASAGLHYVNRVGYLVTEKPWETGMEEAVWYEPDES